MITRRSFLAHLTLLTALSVSLAVEANAPTRSGLTLQSTRVIYPEARSKGVTFNIQNDTDHAYLIQSLVSPVIPDSILATDDKNASVTAPFIVLPPLKRLASGEPLTLTIRQSKNTLPADRESVLAFKIKAIPALPESLDTLQPGQVSVALALQNTLKLFYRPQGLPAYDIEYIADALRFIRQKDSLVVINPGPYYVTFNSLSVGYYSIDNAELFEMVPPFGKVSYPLNIKAVGKINWQLINDYGFATNSHQRELP